LIAGANPLGACLSNNYGKRGIGASSLVAFQKFLQVLVRAVIPRIRMSFVTLYINKGWISCPVEIGLERLSHVNMNIKNELEIILLF